MWKVIGWASWARYKAGLSTLVAMRGAAKELCNDARRKACVKVGRCHKRKSKLGLVHCDKYEFTISKRKLSQNECRSKMAMPQEIGRRLDA
jgi:hypothetical protein